MPPLEPLAGGAGATRWIPLWSSRTSAPPRTTGPLHDPHRGARGPSSTARAGEKAIEAAGYNTFLLRSARRDDRLPDRLRHDGDEHRPVGGLRRGARHAVSTSEAYHELRRRLARGLGYRAHPAHPPGPRGRAHHVPDHDQARASSCPGNMYFTTTKLHQEMAGGVFVDVIVDQAHDPAEHVPVEGQHRPRRSSRRLVARHGAEKIAYISFEHSREHGRRPAGLHGQHEGGLRLVPAHGIPVMYDATRAWRTPT